MGCDRAQHGGSPLNFRAFLPLHGQTPVSKSGLSPPASSERITHMDFPALFSLTNRNVLITGGTGVLGAAMAEGLVAAGAHVALLARNSAKAGGVLARPAG